MPTIPTAGPLSPDNSNEHDIVARIGLGQMGDSVEDDKAADPLVAQTDELHGLFEAFVTERPYMEPVEPREPRRRETMKEFTMRVIDPLKRDEPVDDPAFSGPEPADAGANGPDEAELRRLLGDGALTEEKED